MCGDEGGSQRGVVWQFEEGVERQCGDAGGYVAIQTHGLIDNTITYKYDLTCSCARVLMSAEAALRMR